MTGARPCSGSAASTSATASRSSAPSPKGSPDLLLTPRERALKAAFDAHAASVAAVATRVLGDVEAARDVCQDAFARYFDRMDEVQDDPGPWLRTVALRLALDRLRGVRRDARARAALSVAAAARERERAGADPAFDLAAATERQARVVEALAALPDRQREVVGLRVLEGETFPTVARALGISEGAAKVHLRRALERLRRILHPFLGCEGEDE
jgi:RNA polymerase sigma-70 factor (ECF subfamily)